MILQRLSSVLCFVLFQEIASQHPNDTIIRSAIGVITSTSHLHAVSRNRNYPYPHSETFHSFEHAKHRPCQSVHEERFRRPDGICNNLRHPFAGAALDIESRLFANAYQDGRRFPRIQTKDFHDLPSARTVSLRCFGSEEDTNGDGENSLATQLVWQFGQFLAHDITHVEKVDGSNHCCDDFSTDDPFAGLFSTDGNCFPIQIPPGDPFFNDTCMVFSRTYAVDVFGVREPINAVTSYIDASTVYGSSEFLQKELRLGVRGLLKTSRPDGIDQLPGFGNFPCTKQAKVHTCPVAGDIRVSDQVGLGAIHTMFHLEHNRIAKELFRLNRFWDDERIFQESRKIVIAILQRIVYEEYLPLLLGNDVMARFNLNSQFVYDDSIDARAILEFSTSGLRFGHTLLNTHLGGFKLGHFFLEPITANTSLFNTIPFFQARHRAHEFNNLFTSQIRNRLFEGVTVEGFDPSPGPSFDLTTLNIQRGRDHGIPPYTVVRDACLKLLRGVPGATKQTPSSFNDVYMNEEDIDLFVGGVSEKPLLNAILGPTFACMAGIQFQGLKFGDRFFYEGRGLEGFTKEQVDFIKRNTLASLICELNPDESIQEDPFRPFSDLNPMKPCREILLKRNLHEELIHWTDLTENAFHINL